MTNFENYDYEERYENLQDEGYTSEEIEDMLLSEEEAEHVSSGIMKPLKEKKEFKEVKSLNESIVLNKKLVLKCKPTYNFQSIEFEYTIDLEDENSIPTLLDVYEELVTGLESIAPEQPNTIKVPKEVDSDFEPATEKQLEILKKFKIKHKANVSKEEANKLIQKSMNK